MTSSCALVLLLPLLFLTGTVTGLARLPSAPRVLLASNDVDPAKFWGCFGCGDENNDDVIRVAYVPTASMYLDPDSPSDRSVGQRRQRQRASLKKRMASINGNSYDGFGYTNSYSVGGMYGATSDFPGFGSKRPVLIQEVPPYQGEKKTL